MANEFYQGRVKEVSLVQTGDITVQDHFIGDMVLYLNDVSDFSDEGGQADIVGLITTYNTKDDDLSTVSLGTALTMDVPAETRVEIYPHSYDKWALVELDEGADLVSARVPHSMADRFAEGVRSVGDQEPVLVSLEGEEGGDAVIVDVSGLMPVIDGGYIDPETMPPAPPPPPEPPTVVPTPTVYGTIRGLAVSWPVVTGQDNWTEVHLSTDPNHIFVQGDAATLAATESGLSTRIETDPGTGAGLLTNTDYYVAIFAVNDSGSVGPSATVGPYQLRPVDTADISVNAAWLGNLDADHITDGTLQADVAVVGSLSAQGANGELVKLSGDGFIVQGPPAADGSIPTYVNFPTQGDKPDIFTGVLDATTLAVEQGATLQGVTQVAPTAEILLANQIAPPKNAPSVVAGWDSVNQDQIENSREWHGLAHNTSDNTWWSMWYRASDDTSGLTQWNDAGVMLQDFPTGASRGRARGVVWNPINGGRFFTLRNAEGEAGWVDRLEVWDNTFTTQYESYDFRINYGMFWGTIGWDYTNNELIYCYYNNQQTNPFANGLPQSQVAFEHWTIDADSTIGTRTKIRKTVGSANFAEGIAGAGFGTYDFGDAVSRYVLHLRSEHTQSPIAIRDKFLVFPDAEGNNFDDGWSWPNASSYDVCGLHWDGTNWWSIGAKGTRWKYEGGLSYYHGKPSDQDWMLAYTWRDGVNPYHETTLSPTSRNNPSKRSRLTVTIGVVPTGDADYPDRARIYLAQVLPGTTPPNSSYDLWAEILAGSTSWTMGPKGAPIDSTTGAPAGNTFPSASTPGILTNPAGTVKLSGDGSGNIGGMFWDKTGNLTKDYNKPYISEYRANNLTIPNGGSSTTVNFGTTEAWVNLPAGGVSGNGDGTYTVNMPGKYIVTAQVSWDSNGTNRRSLGLWVNGVNQCESTVGGSGTLNQSQNVVKSMQLQIGDVLSVRAWQNSGAGLAIIGGRERTNIQIAMVAGGS